MCHCWPDMWPQSGHTLNEHKPQMWKGKHLNNRIVLNRRIIRPLCVLLLSHMFSLAAVCVCVCVCVCACVGVCRWYFSWLCYRSSAAPTLWWDINLLSVSFLSLLQQAEPRDGICAHNEQTGSPLCVCRCWYMCACHVLASFYSSFKLKT